MKVWNKIPIKDNGDKLIAIPSCLKFLDPHPYFHLGAPYKDKTSIWKLREEVVNRLVKVNDYLISKSSFNLLIYDSWRPLEVQEFMFKRAFLLECEKSDIDTSFENIKSYPSILKKLKNFGHILLMTLGVLPLIQLGVHWMFVYQIKKEILLKWVAWLIKWMRPQILIFLQT